jgi:hypothetical protein
MKLLGKKAKLWKHSHAKSWVFSHSSCEQIARLPKIAKPPKDGDAKPGVYT